MKYSTLNRLFWQPIIREMGIHRSCYLLSSLNFWWVSCNNLSVIYDVLNIVKATSKWRTIYGLFLIYDNISPKITNGTWKYLNHLRNGTSRRSRYSYEMLKNCSIDFAFLGIKSFNSNVTLNHFPINPCQLSVRLCYYEKLTGWWNELIFVLV